MPLKPFTCPFPETRFLHAGRHVYKFKIRYGHFSRVIPLEGSAGSVRMFLKSLWVFDLVVKRALPLSDTPDFDNTESTVKELEEAIRVILGNLDDLHPFSTDHFTVFPYLSKWERVSKMRFKHEHVHLVPYPYICTVYLELNSFRQNTPCGKEVNKGSDELVKRRNEVSESTAGQASVKGRRVEVQAEISCPQSTIDRTGAECVHRMSKAKHGFEQLLGQSLFPEDKLIPLGIVHKGSCCGLSPAGLVTGLYTMPFLVSFLRCSIHPLCGNSSRENEREFSPASLTMDCNQVNFWGPVVSNPEQRAIGQTEGAGQLLQQMDQMVNKGDMELEGRGLSGFWRSIILAPLQHLFGGKN